MTRSFFVTIALLALSLAGWSSHHNDDLRLWPELEGRLDVGLPRRSGDLSAGARSAKVEAAKAGDWRTFGRDPGAQRYSPLTQITRANVAKLREAWTFDTGVHDLQVTPIVVNGLMYVTAGSTIVALEPETGKVRWRYDAGRAVSRRGVAYWPGDANTPPRLFSGAGDGRMIAVDAQSGALVKSFGEDGSVDLKRTVRDEADGEFKLITPPVIYKDIVITGGANEEGEPPKGLYGDIRGWDARRGKLLWSFHTVPRPGEPGV